MVKIQKYLMENKKNSVRLYFFKMFVLGLSCFITTPSVAGDVFKQSTKEQVVASNIDLSYVQQQGKTITGVIVDNLGEPIIGATIIVVGDAGRGTVTDFDGKFTLSDVPENAMLEVSYVGMQTQTVSAAGISSLNITLAEDAEMLDELVVVGYGTMRKSDLTGAVSSVKATEALKNTPSANVSEALQGRMSGVSVVSAGNPADDMTIRIRGINSVSAETGPLVVIDGFIGGSLKSLNPGDIQSIEVLKDASATAVYGSRGANGVILVTTKSPEKEAITTSFNAFTNFKSVLRYPKSLTPGEFARLANDYGKEYFESMGQTAVTYYTPEQIGKFDSGVGGYDYVRNIFNDPAIAQNYDLSLSGKSDKISFLASARYEKTEGVIKRSEFDQFNWRLKLDVDMKKWVSAGLNFWGNYSQTEGPRMNQYEGLLITASNFANTVNPQDENGNYNNMFPIGGLGAYNPMGHIWEMKDESKTLSNQLQGYVQFNIMDGLTFRSQIGVTFNNSLNMDVNNEKSYYYFKNAHTQAASRSSSTLSWLNTNTLNYVKEFNKNHRINVSSVFEQSYRNNYWHRSESRNLSFVDQIGFNGLDYADIFNSSSYREIETLMSGLLRVNYVFMNRYMFTGSIRADGSSNMDKKWDYFPSLALAWDMKQEHFMETIGWLDQFKLRVGYGSVGNQSIEPYRIFSKMEAVQNADGSTSYTIGRPRAPFLKWERNDQFNVGLDLSAYNGKLTFGIDLYDKKSKDILLTVAQPAHTGWTELLKNAGAIRNRGVEVTVGANPTRGKTVDWQTNFTFTHNKGTFDLIPTPNKMQNQAGQYENQIFKMIEGEKLGTFWGYTYDGVWKTADMDKTVTTADGSTVTNQEYYGVQPGMARYKDVNGDGALNEADKGIIGNGQPAFNWGWSNTFVYKDFDFSLFLIGFHGFDIYNATKAISYGTINGAAVDVITPNPELLNRWTKDNENTDIPGFVRDLKPIRDFSSRFVEKGDFIKLKSVTLGYTLPKSTRDQLHFYDLRLYVSVQNPFHITKYSGLDPEAALGSPLTQGVDWGAYPNGRNYMIGINVSF